MRLRMNFGSESPIDIQWGGDRVALFPNLVKYKGKKWEFIFYDAALSGEVDYDFMFSEIYSDDPNFYSTEYVNIDYMFDNGSNECECGSMHDINSPTGHMFFCKLWRRN